MQLFICKCRFNCYLKVNWPLVKSRKIIRLPEAWAKMYRKVLVTFLKTIVLANIVQVIASDHNCSLHFHLHYYARQDSSTNAHVASKWTFLVNVMTLRCLVIQRTKSGQLSITNNILLLRWHGGDVVGGWALVTLDGAAPSRMVSVSASDNLPLHHKVQKFWHWLTRVVPEKGHKKVVVVVVVLWSQCLHCPSILDVFWGKTVVTFSVFWRMGKSAVKRGVGRRVWAATRAIQITQNKHNKLNPGLVASWKRSDTILVKREGVSE